MAFHLDRLAEMTDAVEKLVPETVQQYYEKLYRKITELLGDRTVDESRLVTEAAVVAEKIAVDEELVAAAEPHCTVPCIPDQYGTGSRKWIFWCRN